MSISVYAGKINNQEKTVTGVFTTDEMTDYFWEELDGEEIAIQNPHYRPELDINMSNDNAWIVLNSIGIVIEDGYFSVGIDEMIGRCTSFLRKRIGKQSKEIETIIEQDGVGPKVVHIGVPTGYIEKQVHRLAVLAREGKIRGADVIYGS